MLTKAMAESRTVPELGCELSQRIGRVVPHDGYMLAGTDPVTGAGCFVSREHGYCGEVFRRTLIDEVRGRDLFPFSELITSPSKVGVLGSGSPEERSSRRLHEVLLPQGFGSEMRAALVAGGVVWGTMTLLRERGRRPFSSDDAAAVQHLVPDLCTILRRFVTRLTTPRPLPGVRPPGVIVVGKDDRIRAASPTGRDWLRACAPGSELTTDDDLALTTWNIAFFARHTAGGALSRVPTADGWIAVQAQRLDGDAPDDVVITVQPTSAGLLLPAVAAWYGVTRRETAVIEQALEGLSAKQIARRLSVSPHTVNDHFKAVYRKTGVSCREELIAVLS
ncbi:helix-turn-helix transcriptional regulator [Streptomyces sp. SCA3-4]|uniref:helix-turn-helix transcriptional regulator n=1 Tax=Streptomyces sichuanensis TaxID=2871810 RepID=UPI001CE34CB5|nr:helix-turn-helix transcriptional regulator [Streptomyces sichuanensis]MCA6091892.1 helix-turn-helix transcriptional regulator [Streptomyces sichuanensis]